VVGWELDRTLTARLPLMALERAVAERQPAAGLVHHSDRGVQYASQEYLRTLRGHGIWPSMSRPANPYDNAQCESFIKTLKREEIYAQKYQDMADLRAHLEEFIDQYYNRLRLHSALGYKTPEEFETTALVASGSAAVSLSFYKRSGAASKARQRCCGRNHLSRFAARSNLKPLHCWSHNCSGKRISPVVAVPSVSTARFSSPVTRKATLYAGTTEN